MGLVAAVVKREVEVDGRVYKVPTHIVRLQGDRVRGWQVRFRNPRSSRFFSDHAHGTTYKALNAAIAWARANRPAPDTQARPQSVTNTPGIAIVREPRKGQVTQVFIVVRALYKGDTNRKFYVGTENTWTAEREAQKMVEAKAYRQMKVATRDAQLKGIRCKSERT